MDKRKSPEQIDRRRPSFVGAAAVTAVGRMTDYGAQRQPAQETSSVRNAA
jgi:hypothetical protein